MADRRPLTRAEFEALAAAYYDCRDSENLSHDHIEEAVEEMIEFFEPGCDASKVIRDHGPLTMTAYRRGEVADKWITSEADVLVEILAEHWTEEYGGNPDGDDPEAVPEFTTAILAAVRAFVAAQKVYPCHLVGEYTYSVEEVEAMMRGFRPDWFDVAPPAKGSTDG